MCSITGDRLWWQGGCCNENRMSRAYGFNYVSLLFVYILLPLSTTSLRCALTSNPYPDLLIPRPVAYSLFFPPIVFALKSSCFPLTLHARLYLPYVLLHNRGKSECATTAQGLALVFRRLRRA